jgi:hypothetical protein
MAYPPPYIIYSGSSNNTLAANAKLKGALGETNDPRELLELVLVAIKDRKGQTRP